MKSFPWSRRACRSRICRPFEEMVQAKLAGLLARTDGYPVHDLYDKVLLARVERPLFDLVLAHTGGNQPKAAKLLGLNRNTLRKKLAIPASRNARRAAKTTRSTRLDKGGAAAIISRTCVACGSRYGPLAARTEPAGPMPTG